MRSVLRIFLLVCGIIGVSILGYYAYTLSTDTLRFPFVGQERQFGNILRLVVSRPHFGWIEKQGEIFDKDALEQSFFKNGELWNPMVSGESQLMVSGEYMELRTQTPSDVPIRLDADIYNTIKKNSTFRLPHSIELTQSRTPTGVSISQIGASRDRVFQVEMYGYDGFDPSDIQWYMHTDPQRNCDIADAWNSTIFEHLDVHVLSEEYNSEKAKVTYEVDYDTKLPRVCIIAGIQGEYKSIIDQKIDEFIATGSIVSMFSPEIGLKSEIGFQFSYDIFVDSGSLLSEQYSENRQNEKIKFLKALTIFPDIPLTEENIILTPDHVTIVGDFVEGTQYNIHLQGITDLYGRKVDTYFAFRPQSDPFLSIKLPSNRSIFAVGEDIDANLYALKTPKNAYTMKLCRISAESYIQGKYTFTEKNTEQLKKIYSLFDSPRDTQDCVKKEIPLGTGYITQFRLQDMQSDGVLEPGVYILALKDYDSAIGFADNVYPRIFSIIDTHITTKIDISGGMSFFLTDINTGKPRVGQSVSIYKHDAISAFYTGTILQAESNTIDGISESTSIATGRTLGTTDIDGMLHIQKTVLNTSEFRDIYRTMYDGDQVHSGTQQLPSVFTQGAGHFGYLVHQLSDTQNDTNLGINDSDFSGESRSMYTAYIHTDSKLYIPGQKVLIHAIVRQTVPTLSIPKDQNFIVEVLDPLGKRLTDRVLKPNQFGTILTEFTIPEDAPPGQYTLHISGVSPEFWVIDNSYTYFYLNSFKKPNFTMNVSLRSDDIENNFLLNLRKKSNTDPFAPWYKDIYGSIFYINGMVSAQYNNGTYMGGVPYTYRIYRSPYQHSSDLDTCSVVCESGQLGEFYTEGTGMTDSDGVGIFRSGIDFSSYRDDYIYRVEVYMTDPITGEPITTYASLLARIPVEYKAFDPYNSLRFIPDKKILSPGQSLSGVLAFEHESRDTHSSYSQYRYEFIHREYARTPIDDPRMSDIVRTHTIDMSVLSGSIQNHTGFTLSTQGLPPGEYHLRIMPHIFSDSTKPPDTSISDTIIYINDDSVDQNAPVRVISEKSIYHSGEIARVFFTIPFTGGHLLITQERNGVIDHEYIQMTGSTLSREYKIHDTFYPNIYIGAVAYASGYTYGKRNYAVGYGEIRTDNSDKMATIVITPDKQVYKNQETANITLKMKEKQGGPLKGELFVLLVDEDMAHLTGDTDIDLLNRFFPLSPFSTRTALTGIGMEKYFPHIQKIGHGGNEKIETISKKSYISSGIHPQPTYYNTTTYTNDDGIANLSIPLPDLTKKYRIIVIGQTIDSHFAVAQETITSQKDYTIESHSPSIAYSGDLIRIDGSILNSTKKITNVTVELQIGTGSSILKKEKSIFLQAFNTTPIDMDVMILESWGPKVSYTLSVKENNKVLAYITKTITIPSVPLFYQSSRQAGLLTATQSLFTLSPFLQSMDINRSTVRLRISKNPLLDPEKIRQGMLSSPYGHIENEVANTLLNAMILRSPSLFGEDIDISVIQKNLDKGLNTIFNMQLHGGWKYWKEDSKINPYISPYVLRSLRELRLLGVEIPQTIIDNGIQNLIDNFDYRSHSFDDPEYTAEVFFTLAQFGHSGAITMIPIMEQLGGDGIAHSIQPSDQRKLSRYGFLLYAYGLNTLGRSTSEINHALQEIMKDKTSQPDFYGSYRREQAIYARFLMSIGERDGAGKYMNEFIQNGDIYSYYTSPFTKIQVVGAMVEFAQSTKKDTNIPITLRSDGLKAQIDIIGPSNAVGINATRGMFADSLQIYTNKTGLGLFYEIQQGDIPKDIYNHSQQSNDISVSRTFDKIDESLGLDGKGNWISSETMTGNIFEKGKLYKVTLTVHQPKGGGQKVLFGLEDFLSGGWKAMIRLSESRDRSVHNSGGIVSHAELLYDRVSVMMDNTEASNHVYVYYIRPQYRGTYLLPPVTVHDLNNPRTYAIGGYSRIEIQ